MPRRSLFDGMRCQHFDENVLRIYSRLLDEAVDLLFEANIDLKHLFDEKYNIHEELAKRETVDAITLWMESIFAQFATALKDHAPHNVKVEQAVQYMSTHFCADLSIDTISEIVKLNPAYQSKQLLAKSKHNIHDIAQQVGYILVQTTDPMDGYKEFEASAGYVNANEVVSKAERTTGKRGKYKSRGCLYCR